MAFPAISGMASYELARTAQAFFTLYSAAARCMA
jgi:hypothetical protein